MTTTISHLPSSLSQTSQPAPTPSTISTPANSNPSSLLKTCFSTTLLLRSLLSHRLLDDQIQHKGLAVLHRNITHEARLGAKECEGVGKVIVASGYMFFWIPSILGLFDYSNAVDYKGIIRFSLTAIWILSRHLSREDDGERSCMLYSLYWLG